MENCDELRDLDYRRSRRISVRRAAGAAKPGGCSKCPCCRDDQAANSTSTTAQRPRKRKRSSVPRPAKPSSEQPGKVNLAPWSRSVIPPDDLPQASSLSPRPQTPSTDNQLTSTDVNDGPLTVHNFSVEEFQHIYHEVVDGMLKFKSGRMRPYSLELGRQVKQKLWERLGRPMMTSHPENKDGLMHVDVTYGVGIYPPLHHVDISGEPGPGCPPAKRAKSSRLRQGSS